MDVQTQQDENIAEKAVALLDRWMARRVANEDRPDYHHTREIAQAIGLDKGTCRKLLDDLTAQGRIKREHFTNGVAWRSINPLPHEPGGVIWLKLKAERGRPKVAMILQREVLEGSRTFWFDAEKFDHPDRAKAALKMARDRTSYNNGWETHRIQRLRLITVVDAT